MNNKTRRRIKKYKKMIGCTVEQATIAIMYEDMQVKKVRQASVCPECGKLSLGIESDGVEYSLKSWVECSECGFTDEIANYDPLMFDYDFDELLFMCKNPKEYGYNKREWRLHVKDVTNTRKLELLKYNKLNTNKE